MHYASFLTFVTLVGLAFSLLCTTAVARDVADMSRYVIKSQRPRIWLTDERLTRLKAKAAAGDADWLAIKASADKGVEKPARENVLNCALAYQVTGDAMYASAAVAGMKALCDHMQTVFSGTNYDRKWNTGKWIGNSFGIAYDWVRDAMSEEDVRALVESPGLATAGEWLTQDYADMAPCAEGARPHIDTNTWVHWAENMGMVWLALHGDAPVADEWGRRAMLAASIWTAYHREVLKGGISFAAIAYGTSVNTNMFKFCEAVKTATGVDLWADLGKWPRDVVYRWLYWTGPDFKTINHYGHHKYSCDYNMLNDGQEMMMLWLADHFRGAETGRLAQGWLKSCSPFPRVRGAAFERFLLGVSGAAAADSSGLPLCYLSEYRGEVVARSDWSVDATWVSLRCGATHTGEFFRADSGHFNITKGSERLVADVGSDEFSRSAYSSDFRNTIVIDGNRQLTWDRWRSETGYDKMWQKTPEIIAKKAEILREFEESFGRITALDDAGDYVYAAGDLTGAYNVPGKLDVARRCTRQMLFLRPNTLVLFDRVDAAEEGVIKWRCHVPTLEAQHFRGEKLLKREVTTVDGGFSVKAAECEMVCLTLLPAGAKVSLSPTSILNKNKGFSGWQMATAATDGPVKSTAFLHVLKIVPTGAQPSPAPSAGADGDKVVLKLSAGGKDYTVFFNAGDGCGGAIKTAAGARRFPQKMRGANPVLLP
ncbi:MAG: heparinase II/III family protein [Planctomycetes bacterium]|nr:heparinase II/III family protein [Planctomycetota bacterium]